MRSSVSFNFILRDGVEQAISRILSPGHLSMAWVAIIYPGRRLPDASSDQPEGSQASNLLACLP